MRVYEAPPTVHAPHLGRRAAALAWLLPVLLLGAAFAYVLVGIWVQRYWP